MVSSRLRLSPATRYTSPPAALSVAISLYTLMSGGGIILVDGGGSGRFPGGGYWGIGQSNVGIAVAVTAVAGVALAATVVYSRRGSLVSPWFHKRRKHALSPKQWKSLFDEDGRFYDGGVKFLKRVRKGGVDPAIRAEVWPFLLGLYELDSSKEDRDSIRAQKREEYDNLRKQCQQMLNQINHSPMSKQTSKNNFSEDSGEFSQVLDPPSVDKVAGVESTVSAAPSEKHDDYHRSSEEADESGITSENTLETCNESSNSYSSDEGSSKNTDKNNIIDNHHNVNSTSLKSGDGPKPLYHEDFAMWQRIICLDAVRANAEWVIYSTSQSSVSETKARQLADSVGLKDYSDLEPFRIFHAARLIVILEAYTLHDPEIGYCQGMSDLLSPIISLIDDDSDAFWCYVGFMTKARNNFRLDELGIRRQLNIVSKIIKFKDSHLYSHLKKLEAEDCFFVYRMVVVLFRRELSLEQIFCLWEVMWADQASIRAGFGKSTRERMRLRAPPNDDLLLYAIAACVLERRKTIIERYKSMDEIMRECNSLAGHLDVWKLLDDAHELVVTLQDKI